MQKTTEYYVNVPLMTMTIYHPLDIHVFGDKT